jgi:hypothetical protein
MNRKTLLLIAAAVLPVLTVSNALANVTFSNVTVGLVEARSDAWGSWLIITLKDSFGNKITGLCSTASDTSAIALPLTDSAAKTIMAIALTAKVSGKTVTGWGIDPAQGGWCGIGNFALSP